MIHVCYLLNFDPQSWGFQIEKWHIFNLKPKLIRFRFTNLHLHLWKLPKLIRFRFTNLHLHKWKLPKLSRFRFINAHLHKWKLPKLIRFRFINVHLHEWKLFIPCINKCITHHALVI